MTFAPEIIEQFLSFVNEDEEERVASLKACALVSPTWCSIAQPLLVSNIYIDTSPGKPGSVRNPEALADILARSPRLISSVVKYKLVGDVSSPGKGAMDITPTLTHLHALEILAVRDDLTGILHPKLESVLPTILSSRHLTNLRLFLLKDFPAPVFRHCVALRHLVLQETALAGLQVSLTEQNPMIKLHTLIFTTRMINWPFWQAREVFEWFSRPSCPFDFSQLRVFLSSDGATDPKSFKLFCRFISKTSHSLERVLIDPSRMPAGQALSLFPAQKLVRLRTLDIPILVPSEQNDVSCAMNFLSNLAAPSLLRTVVFHYRCHAEETMKELPLDTLLSSGHFENLESVTVIAYLGITRPVDASVVISFLQKVFPLLGAKKILTFETYVARWYDSALLEVTGPLRYESQTNVESKFPPIRL
ncbi:hypothetical protein BDN72DRAFT_878012 [Pluteus cervinus]|uniref:Uncharacterized protein n=1 Tax=Pluteus cervinus TaxID=181527 RepID=A0ACD3AXS5_9AGAR|nr:hypothetical protein BDN72DRAFT_878012 [Pluteus cervinus]